MTKSDFENRSLVVIVLAGYACAMVLGALGEEFPRLMRQER